MTDYFLCRIHIAEYGKIIHTINGPSWYGLSTEQKPITDLRNTILSNKIYIGKHPTISLIEEVVSKDSNEIVSQNVYMPNIKKVRDYDFVAYPAVYISYVDTDGTTKLLDEVHYNMKDAKRRLKELDNDKTSLVCHYEAHLIKGVSPLKFEVGNSYSMFGVGKTLREAFTDLKAKLYPLSAIKINQIKKLTYATRY